MFYKSSQNPFWGILGINVLNVFWTAHQVVVGIGAAGGQVNLYSWPGHPL